MRQIILLMTVLVMAVVAWATDTQGDTGVTGQPQYQQELAPGGHLKLELSAGGYTIRGTDAPRIRVFVTAKNPDKVKDVKFSTAMAGSNGKLKITGPHNDIDYVVELPSRLDLTVRLSAGDLEVRGIEGAKDIEMHAGDLNLFVTRAEDYSDVDLSVKVGDLNAGPWSVSKGGIARSFHQTRAGKYKLHAHVGAGDLNVVGD